MKKFIKENWFKILISIYLLMVLVGYLWGVEEKIKQDYFYRDLKCKEQINIDEIKEYYFYDKELNGCRWKNLKLKALDK